MDLDKNIEQYGLVFLDLETTGLDVVMGDAICEIGAFKIREQKIIDKFHSLVNPRKSIPQEAYQVHKISDDQLRYAPYFEKIADKLINFIGDCVVCAYNVGFDMGFIDNHLKAIGYSPLAVPALDVLAMARDALMLSRYNLESVAKALNIDCSNGLHRALDDAFITYQVFFKLIDTFRQKQITVLADFVSLYGFENDFLTDRENQKMSILQEAIGKKTSLTIRYFSFAKALVQETIVPLKVFQENRYWYLLYQGQSPNTCRLRSNRILNIATV